MLASPNCSDCNHGRPNDLHLWENQYLCKMPRRETPEQKWLASQQLQHTLPFHCSHKNTTRIPVVLRYLTKFVLSLKHSSTTVKTRMTASLKCTTSTLWSSSSSKDDDLSSPRRTTMSAVQRNHAATSSSLQYRQRQLKNNQIQHIKLGFYESRLTTSDYAGLCEALRVNKSLTTVEIGFELPRPSLLKILDCVARLPSLQSLALIGLENIPRKLFQRLVSKPGLCRLELRNVTIKSSFSAESGVLLQKEQQKQRTFLKKITSRMMTVGTRTHTNKKTMAVSQFVNFFADSIQSLNLIACDLEDEDIAHICEWTGKRPQPLDSLGFAYYNSMSNHALETLVSQASCRELVDLTAPSSCASCV